MPADIQEEFGVSLDEETKTKIVAGNLARLYGVDIEAKTGELAEDEFARRRRDYLASMPETQEVVGRGAVGSVPV